MPGWYFSKNLANSKIMANQPRYYYSTVLTAQLIVATNLSLCQLLTGNYII
jgi:hypothetical protein